MGQKLRFVKMSGAGNDFVVLDNRAQQVPEPLAAFAAKVADRKRGVGADGVLLVEPSSRKAFRMRYFNADGSEADMCGNGGRCIARYATLIGAAPQAMEFENLAGDFSATVLADGSVSLRMTDPHSLVLDRKVELDGKLLKAHSLNTGVPHLVVPVADVDQAAVFEDGRKLRYHADFQPKGTNVNFVQVVDRHTVKVRTYERGVEDETLACGTGSVACAVAMAAAGEVESPVSVITRGGDALEISFDLIDHEATGVFLKGGAEVSFEGELDLAQLMRR
ncbi:MAG: diaminopimelate epimerase [candidate division FCPU426 bacterium]